MIGTAVSSQKAVLAILTLQHLNDFLGYVDFSAF